MTKSRVLTGTSGQAHPDGVVAIHERILDTSPAKSRFVNVGSGGRVHVIEAGDGPPVVFLHGSSTSSLLLLPLLERLQGAWGIAVDRPGFGLSDPADVPRERFRQAAVEWLDGVLDVLGLDATALAGSSMGGRGRSGTRWPIRNGYAGWCCSAQRRSCRAPGSRHPCA
jgi:pimeloyl-ACP methyl ester carboxylesterase